jgi:hypothetical protein
MTVVFVVVPHIGAEAAVEAGAGCVRLLGGGRGWVGSRFWYIAHTPIYLLV